jgi:membrane protein YqaA with SNARE-associated domain
MKHKNNGFINQAIITFILSVIVILLAFYFQSSLSGFKRLGPVGIFLINFFASATLFVPAPAIATVVAGGAIYPPFLVAFVAATGSVCGDMIGYFLGLSGRKAFLKDHHKKYTKIQLLFKKYGGVAVFFFALVPNPIFDAIGITAGVFGYSAGKFFLLVFLGRILRDIFLAQFGSAFAKW